MRQLPLPILFLPLTVNAQINVSGKINPYSLYRTSDQSHISLPFRMAELKLGYTRGNFDFITNTALEYRWRGNEATPDLREAYLAWYPNWGEVKIGKQIHAWGAVDGNNPTDNLNADDFYYLFLPGADRKIGSTSVSVKLYRDKWQVEAVVIPEHEPNRMTFGEADFPYKPPFEPESYLKIEDPLEYGIKVQTTIGESDFSLSYLKGHDRGFSLLGIGIPIDPVSSIPVLKFGYRNTAVMGGDFVTFLGDITLRVEGAYFKTENTQKDFLLKFDQKGEYTQYVVQVEYPAPYDITVSGQLIGSKIHSVSGQVFDIATSQPVELTRENFQPGMGTPFAMFSKLAFLTSTSVILMDDRLEIQAAALVNLDEKGSMLSATVGYSPWMNWKVETSMIYFMGDKNDLSNVFTLLEDFSHMSFSLQFNF